MVNRKEDRETSRIEAIPAWVSHTSDKSILIIKRESERMLSNLTGRYGESCVLPTRSFEKFNGRPKRTGGKKTKGTPGGMAYP